jgi:hypothetical protein
MFLFRMFSANYRLLLAYQWSQGKNFVLAVRVTIGLQLTVPYSQKMSVCFAFLAWVGMFSAGFCNELWQLYITQGTIAAIGQGAGVTLCVSAPAQWFKKVSSLRVLRKSLL